MGGAPALACRQATGGGNGRGGRHWVRIGADLGPRSMFTIGSRTGGRGSDTQAAFAPRVSCNRVATARIRNGHEMLSNHHGNSRSLCPPPPQQDRGDLPVSQLTPFRRTSETPPMPKTVPKKSRPDTPSPRWGRPSPTKSF